MHSCVSESDVNGSAFLFKRLAIVISMMSRTKSTPLRASPTGARLMSGLADFQSSSSPTVASMLRFMRMRQGFLRLILPNSETTNEVSFPSITAVSFFFLAPFLLSSNSPGTHTSQSTTGNGSCAGFSLHWWTRRFDAIASSARQPWPKRRSSPDSILRVYPHLVMTSLVASAFQ